MINGEGVVAPQEALEFRLPHEDYVNRFIALVCEHLRFFYRGHAVRIAVPLEVMDRDEYHVDSIESRHLFIAAFKKFFGDKGWSVEVEGPAESPVLIFDAALTGGG